ncbi:MAG: AAA family ATPase, partial [Thermoplasmata archaeon]|nr:AAA family ATPase [Thermoplasmata archaeon]
MQPSTDGRAVDEPDASAPRIAGNLPATPAADPGLVGGSPPMSPTIPGASPASAALTAAGLFDAALAAPSELYRGSREILQDSFVPPRLPHREHQIRQVAEVLVPALRGDVPSNLLIYGKIGTGKTAVVSQVRAELLRRPEAKGRISFVTFNCANVDTPYSLLQTIGNNFAFKEADRIPTGWSLDRVQASMRDLIDARAGTLILVLDEIDRLVK